MKTIARHAAALLPALVSATMLVACGGGEDSHTETWEVASNEEECFGSDFAYLCPPARREGSSAWTSSGSIDGFHYEPGFNYTIKVRVTEIDHPMEDGPSQTEELQEIVAKVSVPRMQTFDISVSDAESIEKLSNTSYRLFRQRSLVCAPDDCAVIEAARLLGNGMLLEFDHQNSPAGPMHLLGVTCSAPRESYGVACLGW